MAAAKAEAVSEMDLLSNCMMHSFLGLRLVGKCSCVSHPPTPGRRWAINAAPLWRRSHVDGLEVHRGLDANSVEMRVEPLSCPVAADVAQPGQEIPVGIELAGDAERRHYVVGRDSVDPHAPERPVDDGAVIDQSGHESDRPHLAQQRGVEADLVDAIEDL